MTELLLAVIAALFATVAYFTKRIMEDTKAIQKELKPVTPAIIEIQNKFTENGERLMFPLTIGPGSPLKLTEYGEKVLNDFGFYDVFKRGKTQLVSQVISRNPKTNYDIQEESQAVIRQTIESDDPIFAPLKEYAFNNGLPIELIIPPAGIVLRDEVMKKLKF